MQRKGTGVRPNPAEAFPGLSASGPTQYQVTSPEVFL